MKKKLILASITSAALLSGCMTTGVPDETGFLLKSEDIQNKTFVITHLDGELLGDNLNATMNFKEDKFYGRGFCNLYTGKYDTLASNFLEVEGTEFSKKSCSDKEQIAFDTKLAERLSDDTKHVISKTILGYKVTSDAGSFDLLEIQSIIKK